MNKQVTIYIRGGGLVSLTIGIDAGGTKTTALILDQQGGILFETSKGSGNVATAFHSSSNSILEALSDCLASIYGADCSLIVAGVAGIGSGSNALFLKNKLAQVTAIPAVLMDDALLSYYSVLGAEEGIVTIAGTGSVSIGIKNDQVYYSGGWGHLLGDEGSSYAIAIAACKMLADDYDTGGTIRPISMKLCELLNIVDSADLKQFIYNSAKSQIAELAAAIYEWAMQGHEEAISLFEVAGKELAMQTVKLIGKMGGEAPCRVVGRGSLLEKNEYVFNAFKQELLTVFPTTDIQSSEMPAALGAVEFAKKHMTG